MKNDRWQPNTMSQRYKPSLPATEMEADLIIKRKSFSVKLRAFFYSFFWIFAVPGVMGCLAAGAYLLYNQDFVVALACFLVVFLPIFVFKGLGSNAPKRLYISHCMGFRGMKNALVIGWDGYEYLGTPPQIPEYLVQTELLKMYRNDK